MNNKIKTAVMVTLFTAYKPVNTRHFKKPGIFYCPYDMGIEYILPSLIPGHKKIAP
jgi:hypothetical protein